MFKLGKHRKTCTAITHTQLLPQRSPVLLHKVLIPHIARTPSQSLIPHIYLHKHTERKKMKI